MGTGNSMITCTESQTAQGKLQRRVEDRQGRTAGSGVGSWAGAGCCGALVSTFGALDFIPEALGSYREVAHMVAQKGQCTRLAF